MTAERYICVSMSDRTSLVAGLILERPLCVDCVATKTSLTAGAVEVALAGMGCVVELQRRQGRCRACGVTTDVVAALTRRLPASA